MSLPDATKAVGKAEDALGSDMQSASVYALIAIAHGVIELVKAIRSRP